MLTSIERALFLLLCLTSLGFATLIVHRLIRIIGRGSGKPDYQLAIRRLLQVIFKDTIALEPTFRVRRQVALLHALIAWGFIYFLLVNLGDVLEGFIPDYQFLGGGLIGDLYRLGADLFSLAALVGMSMLLLRRFVANPAVFEVREGTLRYPGVEVGIRRDSLIVGFFVLLHVGFRLLGVSFSLASESPDPWQPTAAALSMLWANWPESALSVGRHAGWWMALGLILLFIPYFYRSKHLHLFLAPLNHLLKTDRPSMGQLDPLDFEDPTIERFGASRIEDLSYDGLLDAYACIMCNRCQDACPAYSTGKVLSPAALEINKRYFLKDEGHRLAKGEASSKTLIEFGISHEAVWACTACGACVGVCPVADEPMRDILELRRHLVLMENHFPDQLQTAFRGMERTANPWGVPPEDRLAWAEGLEIPLAANQDQVELLWWVGCAPATDPRAQKTARAFAKILQEAGVDFSVLGPEERCTGDSARRSGNEYLYEELAQANIQTLNEVAPKRIVTTCPHCLHTLKNEYPAAGGIYQVVHHTQLIAELLHEKRLVLETDRDSETVTFHDPCFLGRQNGIIQQPRESLSAGGAALFEMVDNGRYSFCCGAGGAQMWKEEERGFERVSEARLAQARRTGADHLAVACPFCMIMLSDAEKESDSTLPILDVAEWVVQRLVTRSGQRTGLP